MDRFDEAAQEIAAKYIQTLGTAELPHTRDELAAILEPALRFTHAAGRKEGLEEAVKAVIKAIPLGHDPASAIRALIDDTSDGAAKE